MVAAACLTWSLHAAAIRAMPQRKQGEHAACQARQHTWGTVTRCPVLVIGCLYVLGACTQGSSIPRPFVDDYCQTGSVLACAAGVLVCWGAGRMFSWRQGPARSLAIACSISGGRSWVSTAASASSTPALAAAEPAWPTEQLMGALQLWGHRQQGEQQGRTDLKGSGTSRPSRLSRYR